MSVAGHVRDLEGVDAALVCVPAEQVLGVAREILQQRLPVVECAILEGHALQVHYEALGNAARNHHVPAVAGAGVVLERRGTGGTGGAGSRQSLLLEARFDVAAFAARVMLDAARRLPQLNAGAHRYSLWL